MPLHYQRIKRELGLPASRLRGLFESYCAACAACTYKVEWSCKLSPGRVRHPDRFVHVSATAESRGVWFAAADRLLRAMLPETRDPGLAAILDRLSGHARQLFVGYSGAFGDARAERIKLYFSLSGEAAGLWSRARERIGRPDLGVPAPTVGGWLFVLVLGDRRPPLQRIDLVYDRIEFRDPSFRSDLRSLLGEPEIDFLGAEARGIVSLRQAEPEKLYSFVEFAREESPLRALARRRAEELPLLLEGLDGLTWIGVARDSLDDLERATLTLYTRIGYPGTELRPDPTPG